MDFTGFLSASKGPIKLGPIGNTHNAHLQIPKSTTLVLFAGRGGGGGGGNGFSGATGNRFGGGGGTGTYTFRLLVPASYFNGNMIGYSVGTGGGAFQNGGDTRIHHNHRVTFGLPYIITCPGGNRGSNGTTTSGTVGTVPTTGTAPGHLAVFVIPTAGTAGASGNGSGINTAGYGIAMGGAGGAGVATGSTANGTGGFILTPFPTVLERVNGGIVGTRLAAGGTMDEATLSGTGGAGGGSNDASTGQAGGKGGPGCGGGGGGAGVTGGAGGRGGDGFIHVWFL